MSPTGGLRLWRLVGDFGGPGVVIGEVVQIGLGSTEEEASGLLLLPFFAFDCWVLELLGLFCRRGTALPGHLAACWWLCQRMLFQPRC